MRCLHCHGGEALQTDGHSLARDRCYYCQHSKYGHGRMECEKCQVTTISRILVFNLPRKATPLFQYHKLELNPMNPTA